MACKGFQARNSSSSHLLTCACPSLSSIYLNASPFSSLGAVVAECSSISIVARYIWINCLGDDVPIADRGRDCRSKSKMSKRSPVSWPRWRNPPRDRASETRRSSMWIARISQVLKYQPDLLPQIQLQADWTPGKSGGV